VGVHSKRGQNETSNPKDQIMSTPIEKAQEAMRLRRESGEVITKLSPIEKANKNPKSLRMAINGKCWDCSGGQRLEIRECTVHTCTLYPVRPYQEKDSEDDGSENSAE